MDENDSKSFLVTFLVVAVLSILGIAGLIRLNEPEELTIEQLQPIVDAWVEEKQDRLTESIVRTAEQYVDVEGRAEQIRDQLRWTIDSGKGKAMVTIHYGEGSLSIEDRYELTIRDREVVRWSSAGGSASYSY